MTPDCRPAEGRNLIAQMATRIYSQSEGGLSEAESVESAEEIWDRAWGVYEEPKPVPEKSASPVVWGLSALICGLLLYVGFYFGKGIGWW